MAFSTNGTHGPTGQQADIDLDALYARHMPQQAPQPLPEARSSVNVRLVIGGHDCQLTLRDHDEAALLTRLEALLQRYPVPERPAVQSGSQGEGWCQKHQVQMQLNNKNGRQWRSHLVDGQWCKGR